MKGVDISRLSIALVLPRTRLFTGAQCRNEAQRAHVRRVRPIPKTDRRKVGENVSKPGSVAISMTGGQRAKEWKEGGPTVSKLHVRAQRMRRPRWSWCPGAVPFHRGNWRTETSISYEENFRARINDVVCPHVRRTRVGPVANRYNNNRSPGKIWVVAFWLNGTAR